MIDTDKYEGLARCENCDEQKPLHLIEQQCIEYMVCDECYKKEVPCFEVVWLCEPNEENWDGTLGAGLMCYLPPMYEPRPNFHTEHDAMVYIKNEQLRTRAIIFYYEVDEDGELECVNDKLIEVMKND